MKYLFSTLLILSVVNAKITVAPLNGFWFEVGYTKGVQAAGSGSVTPNTYDDIVINTTIYDDVVEQYTLFADPDYFDDDDVYVTTFSSSNESIATIDSNGTTSWVSDGTISASVTVNGLSRSINLLFGSESSAPVEVFDSFVTGSARKSSYDAIDVVASNSADNDLFDTATHPTTYVRNTSHWMSGWEKSGISVWNSSGGTKKGGALITPRHVLTATHYPIYAGNSISFVSDDGNNTVWTATVQAEVRDTQTDMQVLLLDSEPTVSFQPLKVLPANFADYMPSTLVSGQINEDPAYLLPVVARNQYNELHISSGILYIFDVSWDNKPYPRVSQFTLKEGYPFDANHPNYVWTIIGDSGSPKMTTFDTSELVLLFANWGAGGGMSADKNGNLDDLIKSVDTKAGVSSYNAEGDWSEWPNDAGSYQTQAYDLSSFTNYNP